MTNLGSMPTRQKVLAAGITLSFLLQGYLLSAEPHKRPLRSCATNTRSCDMQRYETKRKPSQDCKCDEQCPCGEQCKCTATNNSRGCPCHKPKPTKPKPKPQQPVTNVISTIMQDAYKAGCAARVPQAVRNCYERAQQRKLTPNDVMHAMPTLMRYALEHMKVGTEARSQKAEHYVEALLQYLENHADILQNHPARKEVMDMLERTIKVLKEHPSLKKRMQGVVAKMNELSTRKPGTKTTRGR